MLTRDAHSKNCREKDKENPQAILSVFYNPMWGFLGDRYPEPPGTHYYRDTKYLSYDWQLYGQVMFRAEVLPWCSNQVEIITTIEDTRLDTYTGRPKREAFSDHFPIFFQLTTRT